MAIGCRFDVEPDGIVFTTKTNGDHIRIAQFNLDSENAANLARLIGSGAILSIQIKAKEE